MRGKRGVRRSLAVEMKTTVFSKSVRMSTGEEGKLLPASCGKKK